jgi:predicted P-loop ATPase
MPLDIVGDVEKALLEDGMVLLFNTFTSQVWVMLDGQKPTFYGEIERSRAQVVLYNAKVKAYANVVEAAVLSIAVRNSFHPVKEYLAGLKWDGVGRLDTWLVDHMGAKDSPYERAVGAITLIAAVRRVREPGCKFDECLVLVGPEGLGKSSTLYTLGRPWFSDSLPLGADPKVTVERTTNVWICESAELIGNSPSKIAEIKAFLSRSDDGPFRAAYGRIPTNRPRQFVPIATTNDSVFLHSASGDRRFWPVEVYFARDNFDRDQLWAEAAARETAGESIRLNPELWDMAKARQEAHRVEDPWEEKLGNLDAEVSLAIIWPILGISSSSATPKDSQRVAAIMRRLGYVGTRKMVNGTRTTYYEKLHQFHPGSFDRNPKTAPQDEDVPEGAVADAEIEAGRREAELEEALVEAREREWEA